MPTKAKARLTISSSIWLQQRMIDHQFDLSNTVLVTDRGYHSLMNMQKLINLELKFYPRRNSS